MIQQLVIMYIVNVGHCWVNSEQNTFPALKKLPVWWRRQVQVQDCSWGVFCGAHRKCIRGLRRNGGISVRTERLVKLARKTPLPTEGANMCKGSGGRENKEPFRNCKSLKYSGMGWEVECLEMQVGIEHEGPMKCMNMILLYPKGNDPLKGPSYIKE